MGKSQERLIWADLYMQIHDSLTIIPPVSKILESSQCWTGLHIAISPAVTEVFLLTEITKMAVKSLKVQLGSHAVFLNLLLCTWEELPGKRARWPWQTSLLLSGCHVQLMHLNEIHEWMIWWSKSYPCQYYL